MSSGPSGPMFYYCCLEDSFVLMRRYPQKSRILGFEAHDVILQIFDLEHRDIITWNSYVGSTEGHADSIIT